MHTTAERRAAAASAPPSMAAKESQPAMGPIQTMRIRCATLGAARPMETATPAGRRSSRRLPTISMNGVAYRAESIASGAKPQTGRSAIGLLIDDPVAGFARPLQSFPMGLSRAEENPATGANPISWLRHKKAEPCPPENDTICNMHFAVFAMRVLEVMFFVGLAGSSVVVIISFIEDAKELFGKE